MGTAPGLIRICTTLGRRTDVWPNLIMTTFCADQERVVVQALTIHGLGCTGILAEQRSGRDSQRIMQRKGSVEMLKGSVKRSHEAADVSITNRKAGLDMSSAKGRLGEQKEAEGLDLQQVLLEHSSEKSCQEQLGRTSAATLTGGEQKHEVDGSSSQGSEPSHRRAWQEKGEQTWDSTTPRCALQPKHASPCHLPQPPTVQKWWTHGAARAASIPIKSLHGAMMTPQKLIQRSRAFALVSFSSCGARAGISELGLRCVLPLMAAGDSNLTCLYLQPGG